MDICWTKIHEPILWNEKSSGLKPARKDIFEVEFRRLIFTFEVEFRHLLALRIKQW